MNTLLCGIRREAERIPRNNFDVNRREGELCSPSHYQFPKGGCAELSERIGRGRRCHLLFRLMDSYFCLVCDAICWPVRGCDYVMLGYTWKLELMDAISVGISGGEQESEDDLMTVVGKGRYAESLIAWNVSCEESKMQFVQRVEIIQLASDVRESPESEQILA